jgi:hypothetical protein
VMYLCTFWGENNTLPINVLVAEKKILLI